MTPKCKAHDRLTSSEIFKDDHKMIKCVYLATLFNFKYTLAF